MMKKLALCLICLITLLLSSCKTTMYYKMEVLRPGYLKQQVDKKDILLIDNSGKQPPGVGHRYYRFGKFMKDTTMSTDSLSSMILSFMSANLSDEGYYKTVKVAPENWLRAAKTESLDYLRPDGLNNSQKKVLKDSISTDYWICLDRLMVRTKTNVFSFFGILNASRDVTVNSVWRVIDVKKDSVCLLFQHNDSLFWYRSAENSKDLLKELPDFKITMPEIADYVATKVYRIFGPYWESVNRLYYCYGSYRMTLAVDFLRKNDWDNASELWQEEYKKGFGMSVYRAAMNMMLYYEYLDKPEDALQWGDRAQKAMEKSHPKCKVAEKQMLVSYIKYLQKRKEELSRLKALNSDL